MGVETEIMEAKDTGRPALTIDMAVGIFRAWLEEHWTAENARLVCKVTEQGVVIEHHEETAFRRGAPDDTHSA